MANLFFGGGLNQRDDLNINSEECVDGENFLLDAQSRTFRPRPPFDLKGTAANGQSVSGILQLIKRDDTDTLLVAAGGTIYSVDENFSFSSKGTITTTTGLLASYWSLDDELLITDRDKNNVIHSWDGSTFEPHQHGIGSGTVKTSTGVSQLGSTVTITISAHGYSNNDLVTVSGLSPSEANGEFVISSVAANTFQYTSGSSTTATGVALAEDSIDLYAKYSVVFNNRMWLLNITAGSTSPHMILASQFENANVFDTTQQALPYTTSGLTGNEAFFSLSPDMKPINGAEIFFNQLVISTINGQLFKLTGSDSTDYKFVEYYPGSSSVGDRTMVNTGNDLMWMTRGAGIDRLSAVETSGDVKADDISIYIPDELSGISDGIAVYDQNRQLIYWFITDKVLVLDKNFLFQKPGISPWVRYTTQDSSSFNTNAAAYIRDPGANTYDVYWGDSSGRLMKMSGTAGGGDAGSLPILARRKSKQFAEDWEFTDIIGRIEYRRKSAVTLNIDIDWSFHNFIDKSIITLLGPIISSDALFFGEAIYWGEDIYWGQGSVTSDILSNRGFSPSGKGDTFFIELNIDSTGDFLINRIIFPGDDDDA